jgi:phosphoribosylformylglycinamidine synthase
MIGGVAEKMQTVQVMLREGRPDRRGERLRRAAREHLGWDPGRVVRSRLYVSTFPELSSETLAAFAREALCDPILEDFLVGRLRVPEWSRSFLLVARRPGVTDDEGISAQKALRDFVGRPLDVVTQRIHTQELYFFEADWSSERLLELGWELLANPLIHHLEAGPAVAARPFVAPVAQESPPEVAVVDLFVPDRALEQLSRERVLSLSLEELRAIREYYSRVEVRERRRRWGLPLLPTDCELEIFAQTWSEHCKHKEFNALIEYRDLEAGTVETIDSLFRTYIRGATERVRVRLRAAGNDWLVTVFEDNAGVVRVDEDWLFVWKVETHNTPSALDPYGGAITGILGNNRDPLGTGRGGARCLFNTNVLCFGPPDYAEPLLPGQLHPRRVFEGVRQGIEDGGNKSGIPTVNGAIVFDARYAGKPLVYCGTGALLPARLAGRESWVKEIDPGDRILMAGGRVGKDGIHGATFSSLEIDRHSPRTAVQIGSPITQKMLSDFLEAAAARGLIKCSTDNGAGGLSSSVGELARIPGGARVQLERVPLKYPGLQPWEIFLSESQERMTLVVAPEKLAAVMGLAAEYEVEVTEIGWFTDEGVLDVRHGERRVACLDLDFLHDGVPRKHLVAEWRRPAVQEPRLPPIEDHGEVLLRLLGGGNVCSREAVIRQYDHEVKGRTIVKPLMGPSGHAPQDAAVLRLHFDGWRGIAVSNGIAPRYGDIDAYAMSAGAFDEAVRQIIAVGGELPDPAAPGNRFWSVNDNFCVPDSAYDPETNPDGKYKLAQLVRMARALYDMSVYFNIPMTSGKDSMKNDFRAGGVKISVPPTILYSMVAALEDVRRVVTTEFKAPGDLICLLGATRDELGGSELYRLFGELGANVPRVRPAEARALYLRMGEAHRQGLFESAHDLSDGGLAVALAECCFGGELGCDVSLDLPGLAPHVALYSESHSRFLVSVRSENLQRLRGLFGECCLPLGRVTEAPRLRVAHRGRSLIDLPVGALFRAWDGGLGGVR